MAVRKGRAALLAVSLLLLLAAGVAALQGKQDAPTVPESLTIPAPRPGDRAHYEVRTLWFDPLWQPPPFSVSGIDVEWKPATPTMTSGGRIIDAPVLSLAAPYDFSGVDFDGRPIVYSSSVFADIAYDPSTWDEVDVTLHEEFPERGPGGTFVQTEPPGVVTRDETDTNAWYRSSLLQLFRGPCGFAPDLVDASLDAVVRLGGSCGRLLRNDGTWDAFAAVGVEQVGDIPTIHFVNVDDPVVHVWYNPGLPFPVKVQDHFVDIFAPEKTNGWVFEWTLAGYEPGSGSYAPSPAPQGGPGTLEPVTLVDGLPDETGAEHPFPLSAAVQAALTEPDVAAYVASGAYLGDSTAIEFQDEEGVVAWEHRLVFTDGRSTVSRLVRLEAPPIDMAPSLPPVPGNQLSLSPTPVVQPWEPGYPADVTGLFPDPSVVPDQMPRVADALQGFFAGANATVRAEDPMWAVSHFCWGDCTRPVDFLRVGVTRVPEEAELPVVPGVIGPPDLLESYLDVRHDGTIFAVTDRTETLVADDVLGSSAAPSQQARTVSAPASGIPYAPIVLAASGLALLSVLLWLKFASGVGLFSRIQNDRLLDHQGRATIITAIESEPGIHLQALARRTGMAAGALRHHLAKLEAAGLIVVKPLNGYACHFLPTDARRPEAQASAIARSPGAQQVLEAWRGGVTGVRAIAAATGLSPSTVSTHLARLRAAGALGGEPEAAAAS